MMPALQFRHVLRLVSLLAFIGGPAMAGSNEQQVASVEASAKSTTVLDGIAPSEAGMGQRLTWLTDGEEGNDPDVRVLARVDLSDQRMYVYVDGKLQHVWRVSTGRKSYGTPTGRWNAEWLSPRHRSRKYNNAPMPWAVFFYKGYAVHGTTEVKRLGRPASHGCVRLETPNAKTFFQLVKANGMDATLISIVR